MNVLERMHVVLVDLCVYVVLVVYVCRIRGGLVAYLQLLAVYSAVIIFVIGFACFT